MSGNPALLDSNILIYFTRAEQDIPLLLSGFDRFIVSVITYSEVLGYSFRNSEEEALLKGILSVMEIIPISTEIADIAISIRKKRKIALPDALILATSSYTESTLLTADKRLVKAALELGVSASNPLS